MAIGQALDDIRLNRADVMLAGGTEAGITKVGIGGFGAMRALSRRNEDPASASRPFDAERDGFVMGEAGAIVVLEELEHAQKRGAKIYAELSGYGISSDAQHITEPDPTGSTRAGDADGDGRLRHRPRGDRLHQRARHLDPPRRRERDARHQDCAREEKARKTPISSTKGATAIVWRLGAIEAITSIFAVQRDVVPPTINYEYPDPECDLDYIPNESREWKTDVALSNNFGFGATTPVWSSKSFGTRASWSRAWARSTSTARSSTGWRDRRRAGAHLAG
jgi:3-oxoacyl-[acyl-carrier-protein] synthase II